MTPVDLHLRETPPQRRNYAADEPMHPLRIRGYRKMTSAEKLDRLARLYASACEMYAAGVRMRHPEFSEEQVQRDLRARILYGVA